MGCNRDFFARACVSDAAKVSQMGLYTPDRYALISPVSTGMGTLIFIAIAVFLVGPILAIVALVAVRRLEGASSALNQLPSLTSRIYVLEKRILAFETSLSAAGQPDIKARPEPTEVANQARAKEPIAAPTSPEPAA